MPSLFRFLRWVALLAALVFAVLYALGNFIGPTEREIVVPVELPPAPAPALPPVEPAQ